MPTFILKISKELLKRFREENLEKCERWPNTFNKYASDEFLIEDKLISYNCSDLEIIKIGEE